MHERPVNTTCCFLYTGGGGRGGASRSPDTKGCPSPWSFTRSFRRQTHTLASHSLQAKGRETKSNFEIGTVLARSFKNDYPPPMAVAQRVGGRVLVIHLSPGRFPPQAMAEFPASCVTWVCGFAQVRLEYRCLEGHPELPRHFPVAGSFALIIKTPSHLSFLFHALLAVECFPLKESSLSTSGALPPSVRASAAHRSARAEPP